MLFCILLDEEEGRR